MLNIAIENQETIQVEAGTTPNELLEQVSLDITPVVALVDGQPWDLSRPLETSSTIAFRDVNSDEGLEVLRHSTAHLMAQAIKRLHSDVQITIGPVIENGFYYDIARDEPFTPADLKKIEKEMLKIRKEKLSIEREEVSSEDALALFSEQKEDYKCELIRDLGDAQLSLYRQGEFVDLCRGPHLPNTKKIGAFKLLQIAGAYWRGDEKNAMLQRIYGTAWPTKDAQAEYLKLLEEAKQRDHRKLGRELDLFSVQEEIGPGLILWHPKGARVRRTIEDYLWKQLDAYGYEPVYTPHVAREQLWGTSGHLDHYAENMYPSMEIDEQRYRVKPMNCPFHAHIYHSKRRSYRELPVRLAELGTVYRYERGGVLHGLLRVRGFTQDDAHIFCRPEQIEAEVRSILQFVTETLDLFGFTDREFFLSTQSEEYIVDAEHSQAATDALHKALTEEKLDFDLDAGEGAFYGPKIDIVVRDSLRRKWQCGTVQVDFTLPERFQLRYTGEDGQEHRPVMIHRAIFGSLERFFGILVEHYAGKFPYWLAPEQVRILPVSDRHNDYAETVLKDLREAGVRVDADTRAETLGKKIREAQKAKIPVMLIVGDDEQAAGTAAPRLRNGETLDPMSSTDLIDFLAQQDAESRTQQN